MKMGQHGQELRKLIARFTRADVIFGSLVIGIAIVGGAVATTAATKIYLLSLAWCALLGLALSRILEANRDAAALASARQREVRQRVINHDMASALLAMEGGIMALRLATKDAQASSDDHVGGQVESIAHALEVEIRRMRRTWGAADNGGVQCTPVASLDPVIALHRANGARIDTLLAADAELAIASDDLVRVLGNVLDNCAVHAPGAAVRISGLLLGTRYHLVVSDEGPGMPDAIAKNAVERGVSSRRGGGLGLYSARVLVEAVGGSITVTSSPTGTAVGIDVPAVPLATPAPTDDPETAWTHRVAV